MSANGAQDGMLLILNGQDVPIAGGEDLRPYWDQVRGQRFTELWLDAGEDGPTLGILVNGERAMLVYLRDHDGDPGFTSCDPDYAGPADAMMEFMLDNGQRDEQPAAWAIPLPLAMAACEQFVATRGERPPIVTWYEEELERLAAGITEENRHGEVNTGPPIGNEAR